MTRIYKILIPLTILLLWSLTARLEPAPAAPDLPRFDPGKLVEARKCQICHRKDDVGNQWSIWEEGPHAHAFESLKTEKAKEVAAKMGIDDPATSGACLQCHSTAYAFTTELATKKVDVASGVTCQSCHGPGDDYVIKHRNNTEKAYSEWGMIEPTAANTCYRCHNENNPTFDPKRYTLPDGTTVDFDFEQASRKIAHPKK